MDLLTEYDLHIITFPESLTLFYDPLDFEEEETKDTIVFDFYYN